MDDFVVSWFGYCVSYDVVIVDYDYVVYVVDEVNVVDYGWVG